MSSQSQVLENFVKRLLASLDETNPQELAKVLQLVNPTSCKIIVNSTPFAQPGAFLELWQSSVVQTQHVITGMDYHVIPGTGTLICSMSGKVRFDESGRDKTGMDAVVPGAAGNTGTTGAGPSAKPRPLWGPYFGVSLQLVLDDRVLANDFNAVMSSLNYTMVYAPDDSLMDL
ncbi:LAMI_0A01662g1_1 [Lachancea mirantina]|uniref:LAMI_0A01662g1_1 n=1 Tax=Lachancea mirantina TaxID=1230905 RepID=A0A1G4IMH7_9SACH|nr:LAMI_0A01662g1_1 [Lachancea mirantina]